MRRKTRQYLRETGWISFVHGRPKQVEEIVEFQFEKKEMDMKDENNIHQAKLVTYVPVIVETRKYHY